MKTGMTATGAAVAAIIAGAGAAAAGERMAGFAAKRFERLDGNGDGAVERAEFGATAGDRFRRLDADGDGSVTRDELQGSFRRGG